MLSVVNALIKANASLNLQDGQGKTAMIWGKIIQYSELINS
jgi:hypothetical protein